MGVAKLKEFKTKFLAVRSILFGPKLVLQGHIPRSHLKKEMAVSLINYCFTNTSRFYKFENPKEKTFWEQEKILVTVFFFFSKDAFNLLTHSPLHHL